MRKLSALFLVALANIPFAARAAVSDDLRFCSNLTDRTERVACYNAAARIAETARHRSKGAPTAAPAITMQSAPAGAVSPPYTMRSHEVPVSRFDGFYAAVGATYGVSTARPFSSFAFPAGGDSGETMPQGPSGVATAGYNFTTGRLLIGLELDGRWGRETASTSTVQSFTDPGGLFSNGTVSLTYKVTSDLAAHLSLRAGGLIGDTLLFGKVGVGAARVTDNYGADLTQLSSCGFITFPSCAFRQFGGAGSYETTKWAPSFLFGVGAEHNFGSFFVRVNAEAEMVGSQKYNGGTTLPDGKQVSPTGVVIGTGPGGFIGAFSDFNSFWTARAGGMVGVRF
jgi:hypothetical protein